MTIETGDPYILIEEQRYGYVRYCNTEGLRWEVHGVCDHRRHCMVGAVVNGQEICSVEEARTLPSPDLDCPVGPGFSGCCELRVRVL